MDLLYIPVNHEDSVDSMDCFHQLSLVTIKTLNCDLFCGQNQIRQNPRATKLQCFKPQTSLRPVFQNMKEIFFKKSPHIYIYIPTRTKLIDVICMKQYNTLID